MCRIPIHFVTKVIYTHRLLLLAIFILFFLTLFFFREHKSFYFFLLNYKLKIIDSSVVARLSCLAPFHDDIVVCAQSDKFIRWVNFSTKDLNVWISDELFLRLKSPSH